MLNNSKELSNNREIKVDLPDSIIGYFIGANSYFLNKIKLDSKINLIWFNKSENNIIIYGKNENLDIAECLIKERVNEIYNKSIKVNEFLKLKIDLNLLPLLIGKNGFFFKKIKEETNILYLWYNKDSNLIEIKGDVLNVFNAKKNLIDRMNYLNFMYNDKFKENDKVDEVDEVDKVNELKEENILQQEDQLKNYNFDFFKKTYDNDSSESIASSDSITSKIEENKDFYSIIESLSINSKTLKKSITITINNDEKNHKDDKDEIEKNTEESNYNPPSMITFLPEGGFVLPKKHVIYFKINDVPDIIISMLIGKKGFYFNEITKKSNTSYIWYDKEKKHVEIWGPPNNLNNAKLLIENRLNMLLLKFNNKLSS